jgi:hypothetical protein
VKPSREFEEAAASVARSYGERRVDDAIAAGTCPASKRQDILRDFEAGPEVGDRTLREFTDQAERQQISRQYGIPLDEVA